MNLRVGDHLEGFEGRKGRDSDVILFQLKTCLRNLLLGYAHLVKQCHAR